MAGEISVAVVLCGSIGRRVTARKLACVGSEKLTSSTSDAMRHSSNELGSALAAPSVLPTEWEEVPERGE